MTPDLAILGAGVMGLAAAWRAARGGATVVVLERDGPGSSAGSSHGATRIFRFTYDNPDYVALARASLPLWHELSPGNDLIAMTGGIDVGPLDALQPCADALRAAGARFRLLEPDRRARAYPWLRAPEDAWCVASPDAGVIAASRTIDALLGGALAAGATIAARTTVRALEPDDAGVTLHTDDGAVRARRCIVATGAWTASLLEPVGIRIPLRVTREQVGFFGGAAPPVPVIERTSALRYLVPAMHGAPGSKAGEHGTGIPTSADARTFDEDAGATARLRAWISAAFPALNAEPVGFETCLYTTTPDEDFVIDRRGRVVILSPCSGHGFKFAPLIGEIAARLAEDAEPPVPIHRFQLERFQEAR